MNDGTRGQWKEQGQEDIKPIQKFFQKKLCKPIDEVTFNICAKFDAHKFDLVYKNQKVQK